MYSRDPQGNATTCYDILSIVTAGVYRTTWWSHSNYHFKRVMTDEFSWTWNALKSTNKIFSLCLKQQLLHLKNCQMFLMHPVRTSIYWINFALFVAEGTSHVIVSMHILCVVEYGCQRTFHVNLENGLQISEMLQCSWFQTW